MASKRTTAAAQTGAASTEYFAYVRHGSSTPLFGRGAWADAQNYQRMLAHGAPLNGFTVRPATPVEVSSIRRGRYGAFWIAQELAKHRRQAGHRQ